jgi:tetratricopeptide (TPR) repeat protein
MRIYYCRVRPSAHDVLPQSRRAFAFIVVIVFCLGIERAMPQSQNSEIQRLLKQGQAALDANDFVTATSAFEQAQQAAPDNLIANRSLLLSYLQSGRLPDAVDLGTKAVAHWPNDAQLQHWLGLAYFKQKMNGPALETLRRSETLNNSQFGIHFDIALVLLSQEQYPSAADELEKAIKLNPSDALAHVLLGRAYQNSNRTLKAIGQFQIALRLDPNLPLGHYHLGFAYSSLGRDPEAIAEYKKETVRSPEDPNVLYELGHSLLETGDWQAALAYLKKAATLDPQNTDASYDLGKAALLAGDAQAAVTALRHTVEVDPKNASAHYQLSRALDKLGQKEEAQQERQRFAELKKTQPQSGGMATARSQ